MSKLADLTPLQIAMLLVASLAAGAINAVAGGGTLVTFPALLALGLSPFVANATNAVALAPAQAVAAFGYRNEVRRDRAIVRALLPVALVGGVAGAVLLLVTPARVFSAIVPVLVLGATAMLVVQNLRTPPAAPVDGEWRLPARRGMALGAIFLTGVYGGYFGAAVGMVVLALLGHFGGRDIHRMNGVKCALSAAVNAIAAIVFAAAGAIDVPLAVITALGAGVGGLLGAALAHRVPARAVRWLVVAIGVGLGAHLLIRSWVLHAS